MLTEAEYRPTFEQLVERIILHDEQVKKFEGRRTHPEESMTFEGDGCTPIYWAVLSLNKLTRESQVPVGNRRYGLVEKYAHTYGARLGIKVQTRHRDGVVVITRKK